MSERRATDRGDYTADELVRATRRLDLALSEWHGELAREMGMGEGETLVLARLAADGRQGPSDLARGLHVTTGAMTALLDRLVERGHLVREPHPTDRRRVALRLTASAHETARVHVQPMSADIAALARRLSPAERATVGRFFDELAGIVARHAGVRGGGPRGSSERTT